MHLLCYLRSHWLLLSWYNIQPMLDSMEAVPTGPVYLVPLAVVHSVQPHYASVKHKPIQSVA